MEKPFHVSMRMLNAFHVKCDKDKLKIRLRWSEKTSKDTTYLLSISPRSNRRHTITPSNIKTAIDLVLPDMRDKFRADQVIDKMINETVQIMQFLFCFLVLNN